MDQPDSRRRVKRITRVLCPKDDDTCTDHLRDPGGNAWVGEQPPPLPVFPPEPMRLRQPKERKPRFTCSRCGRAYRKGACI
jgi:hypothetical protein